MIARRAKRKGQAMVINPALTTAYQVWEALGRGPENNVCGVAPFLSALVLVGNTSA